VTTARGSSRITISLCAGARWRADFAGSRKRRIGVWIILKSLWTRSEVRTSPIRLRVPLLPRDEMACRAVHGFVTALRFHLPHHTPNVILHRDRFRLAPISLFVRP
jgi:hypothetical protein